MLCGPLTCCVAPWPTPEHSDAVEQHHGLPVRGWWRGGAPRGGDDTVQPQGVLLAHPTNDSHPAGLPGSEKVSCSLYSSWTLPTVPSHPTPPPCTHYTSSPRRSNSYAGERRYRTHRRQASNTSNNSTSSEKEGKSHTHERDQVDSDPSSPASPDL